jgi:diguanylate cyclase (GGDEF)-like protein
LVKEHAGQDVRRAAMNDSAPTPRPDAAHDPGMADDALAAVAASAELSLQRSEAALLDILRDYGDAHGRSAALRRVAVELLADALEARDGATARHCRWVAGLALGVARRLGLSARDSQDVRAVGLLHDIGKLGLPDAILHKPGPLDEAEQVRMREHPVIGGRILQGIPELAPLAEGVRAEHERWDGTGYPRGLAADEIPLAARIVSACDAYHAMVIDQPYRPAIGEDAARAALREGAGRQFDPEVVDALLAVLERGETARIEPLPGAAPPVRTRDRAETELRALVRVSGAVAGAHRLEDVLEVAAEQALAAASAASVSISRWERDRGQVRTLVNVGDLAPGEVRHPEDETYPLSDFPLVVDLLQRGESHVSAIDDPEADPAERALLRELGKECCIAVPIVHEGRTWGELYVTRAAGEPRFDGHDARLLEAIAGQIAAGIGRAELFTLVSDLAFQDGLTGLANRRALDSALEDALAPGGTGPVALLVGDVDDFKAINDRHGHDVGDTVLSRVAHALSQAASLYPDTMVARAGGDEFCVVVPGQGEEAAATIGLEAARLLAGEDDPVIRMSFGAAEGLPGAARRADLFRTADGAQYAAKRAGGGRVFTAAAEVAGAARTPPGERRERRGARERDLDVLVVRALELLDGRFRDADPLQRLEVVTVCVAEAFMAAAWAIAEAPDAEVLISRLWGDARPGHALAAVRYEDAGSVWTLADYPATLDAIRSGGGFVVRVDDPESDPAERALLAAWDYAAVAGAGVPDGAGGGRFVELFADEATADLERSLTPLRLLCSHALAGAPPVGAGRSTG